ncbi:very long chain fatty acid elongase F-like [Eurosta solidaginis]|uniref:very long chain fatty acid elongase F-like n=1 Tax=Eurosta solidaginis TaxID=178769 RepID=UPI003530DED5
MAGVLRSAFDFLTSPSEVPEAYKYLPYHGALLPLVLINIAFVLFCFRIGPWLMRNREPYNLKRVIRFYNIFQIIYNLVMFSMSCRLIVVYIKSPRGFCCIEQLPYDHPFKNFEMLCGYLYLINKFLDYTETVFFILRKSYKQVTFLHVYHHVMISTYVFLYLSFQGTGGHPALAPMINTLIHTIMYTYYLMSSLDGNIKKSLWWKKYITQIQLLQFVVGSIHQMLPLFNDCPFPKFWIYANLFQAVVLLYLFGNFYISNYIRSAKNKRVKEKKL